MPTQSAESRIYRSLSSVVFAMCCGLLISPVLLAAPTADLLVVFDASGSMDGEKLADARAGLKDALSVLPANSNVGLESFSGCEDSEIKTLVPIGPLDRSAMAARVDAIQASGSTALEKALRQGASTLGTSGKKAILLLSDGEDTCNGDPCAAVKSLVAGGIELVAYVVGFKVDSTAESQLKCIAQSTGGKYFRAEDGAELKESMKQAMREATPPQVFSDCLQWVNSSTSKEAITTSGRCVRLPIDGASGITMGSASRITIYPTTDCSGSDYVDIVRDTTFCGENYPSGKSLNDNARSVIVH